MMRQAIAPLLAIKIFENMRMAEVVGSLELVVGGGRKRGLEWRAWMGF